ncbi:MAG: hypothetical protein ABIN36_14750 [Ferruginibacter sp.]
MGDDSNTNLVDSYLQSLEGMTEAEHNPFFYTRLKGRMQQQQKQVGFFFKPAWAILTLGIFLTFNIWMVTQQQNIKQDKAEKKSSLQVFAETYNLNSVSNY